MQVLACYLPADSIAFSDRLLLVAAADALKGQGLKEDTAFIDSLDAYTKRTALQECLKKQFEKEPKKKQEEEQEARKKQEKEQQQRV